MNAHCAVTGVGLGFIGNISFEREADVQIRRTRKKRISGLRKLQTFDFSRAYLSKASRTKWLNSVYR